MKTEKNQLRIEEGTKLTVEHNGEDLTFIYSSYGLNTYADLGAKIEQDNLSRPTFPQTTSLIYTAFNSEDKYSKNIKRIMENFGL